MVAISQSRTPITSSGLLGVEDDVVEAEVAVDDAGSDLGWLVLGEPLHDPFVGGGVRGVGRAEPFAPALHLAADVALRFSEVGQAGGAVVDLVQLDQFVDDVAAQGGDLVARKPHVGWQVLAQDDALDAFHDVEITAHDRWVLAVGDDPGHVGVDRGEGVQHPHLAPHVVGGLRLAAVRRPAQHQIAAARFHQVGEVGGAGAELGDLERAGEAGIDRRQVLADRAEIELLARAHGARCVDHCARYSPRMRFASDSFCTSSGPS